MHLRAMILWRIADGPISYSGLLRLVRHRHPRILPDAVDAAIAQLSRLSFIEHRQGKWRVSRAT